MPAPQERPAATAQPQDQNAAGQQTAAAEGRAPGYYFPPRRPEGRPLANLRERVNEVQERRAQAAGVPVAEPSQAAPAVEPEIAASALPLKTKAETVNAALDEAAQRALAKPVLAEVEAQVRNRRFDDALKILDSKIKRSDLAPAAPLLKRERADIAAIQQMRDDAWEALKQKAGQVVTLTLQYCVFKEN
jgi:hypothetical protein